MFGGSAPGGMDAATTQFGLINSLRTGNVILDMLVCMAVPMLFGGIAGVLQGVSPAFRKFADKVRTRNDVSRTISHERRINQYGWSCGNSNSDHLLQKALMMCAARRRSAAPRARPGPPFDRAPDRRPTARAGTSRSTACGRRRRTARRSR